MKPTTTCMFCGRSGQPMTKEDVIPVWLWNLIKGLSKDDHVELSANDQLIRPFRAKPGAVTIGGVCASCNNGWMSRLETEFKAIATSAITGDLIERGAGLRLDQEAQRTVATWALKTWLLVQLATHHATRASVRSPDALRYLHDHGEPPNGPLIYLATVNLHAGTAIQVQTSRLSLAGTNQHGVISLMNVRPLAFCIVMPEIGGIATLPNTQLQTALVQIWPPDAQEVLWPTNLVLTQEWIDRLFPAQGITFPP